MILLMVVAGNQNTYNAFLVNIGDKWDL